MTQHNLSRLPAEIATHLHSDLHVRIAKVAICRIDFAICQCCVVWRDLADWSEAGKKDRHQGKKATEGGRDKNACHAAIQAAVAACLLACRAVGRWQVLRFYAGNSMLRPAQWQFGTAATFRRMAP